MDHALKIIDRISELVGKAASFLVLPLAGVMGYDVIARYVFNAPTIWAHETTTFLFGALSILGIAYTLKVNGHINVDIIHKRFSPRARAIVDIVTSLLFFSFCSVLLWKGFEMAWSSLIVLEFSARTPWEPPIYPIKMTMPIAAFLLLLQGLAKFIRDLTTAIKGREIA
ncbi:TRAP transporter small permease subunit [Chloroflexota bacterium]